MPTYRSINISLHSQFDLETLPEYYPLTVDHYTSRGITKFTPPLVDDKTSTCSVYIPVLPGSTFWIGYYVSPPVPEGHHFLFKLYIDGSHVISWSTGKDDDWQGKTMFGLFGGEDNGEGRRIEKRVLCFAPLEKSRTFDEKNCVEIRVHRAHGRVRIERNFGEYKKVGEGVRLVSAGRVGPEQPKRFYKFALIDPTDQPFATFRYYYRTWEQLRDLGMLEGEHSGTGEENDLSIIEPEGSVRQNEGEDDQSSNSVAIDYFQNQSLESLAKYSPEGLQSAVGAKGLSTAAMGSDMSEQPRVYIPHGAPTTQLNAPEEQPAEQHSGVFTPPSLYRLSIPPAVKFDVPVQCTRLLPSTPSKAGSSSSTSYCPHPAYPVEEWTVYIPSPVKSVRDSVMTPPLLKKGKASSLMDMISATWKRRGVPKKECVESGDGVRSVTLR